MSPVCTGSLPLGVLQAIKGGAEEGQSGKRVQGAKDIGEGLLDAATIPASFAAPPDLGKTTVSGVIKGAGGIAERSVRA
ncbi:MAG: hypothetical protein ACRD4Q_15770, partial [Candidatus Acidiferrales bacterium]